MPQKPCRERPFVYSSRSRRNRDEKIRQPEKIVKVEMLFAVETRETSAGATTVIPLLAGQPS